MLVQDQQPANPTNPPAPAAHSQPQIEDFGEDQINVDDQWQIINAYFEQNGVVNQQIQSFNRFIQNMIQDCVSLIFWL